MAKSKLQLWRRFGRFSSAVILACFFLPFFGVSCGGMDVITVSGTDMVGGCKPGGLISDAEEKKAKHHGADDGMNDISMSGDVKVTGNVEREPLAIVALALAIVVFGLSWVRTRGALIAACVVSIMCLGTLVGLYLKVGRELSAEVDKELQKENAGSKMMKDADVDAGSRYGLWITCLSLIGIAAVTGLAWREPEGSENAPPQAPQPG